MMRRISTIGLALVAMSVMGVFSASPAFAGCELALGFCVAGKALEAGQTKELLGSADSNFVLKGSAFGVKSVTTCTKLKLNAAEKPVVVGGMPGTGEKALVEFSECTATLGGSACKAVTISNIATRAEQVMVLKPEANKGKLATLFRPASGEVFTTLVLKECGLFGTQEAEVKGSTAMYDEPVLVEQLTGLPLFKEGTEEIREVEKFSGAKELIGLKFGGEPATLTGTAGARLVSDQNWGVF